MEVELHVEEVADFIGMELKSASLDIVREDSTTNDFSTCKTKEIEKCQSI